MEQLKLFISSTQKDLQDERNSVQAAVEELGHTCLRAETYSAPGSSPKAACVLMARECDVYIGIFGSRYGFVVPELGISATEMEFREARSQNPAKIFVYVKKAEQIEPEQERFLNDVQDFSSGYFRHEVFTDGNHLIQQIRNDIVTWTTRQVRRLLEKEIEAQALREKVAHQSRVMALYGIPEHLR